jgi:HEAT repeat protein
MINKMSVNIIGIGVFAFVFIFSGYSRTIASDNERAATQVENEFKSLRFKTGKAYIQARDAIVAFGSSSIPALEEKRTKALTWQDRLLSEILTERIRNPRAFERIEKIINKAKLYGSHSDRNRVSQLFLQSKFVEMKDDAILPALEVMLFLEERPDVVAGLARSLAVFKDERIARPLSALLDKDAIPFLQLSVVDAIQRFGSPRLGPDLVRFYHETKLRDVKWRITRALSIMGDSRVLLSLQDLLKKEKDAELKKALDDAYKKIADRGKRT